MARGKQTCKILKEIRRQIAEANGIEFATSECRYKGDCLGTCPKCEAEVRYLEQQLRDCLNRPATVQEVNDAPLATIYYPINQYRLTRQDARVLKAVSYIMIDNSDKKYVITGYADNYTGTDEYNTRLRHNRANGVKNQLVKYGVSSSQLDATVDNNNLCDLGEKFVSLDRAVTIKEAK